MGLLSFLKRYRNINSQSHKKKIVYQESDNDAERMLKRRARQRLIGAFLLVGVSIAVLPRIFDTVPQRTSVPNIQIDLKHHKDTSITSDSEREIVSQKSVQQTRPSHVTALGEGEKFIPASSDRTAKFSKKIESTTTAQTGSSGTFFLKAGAFASERRAYNWLTKLKAAKLPAYIHHKKITEGERYLVRVGPFIDHATAQAVQKKLQTMGLPSIISEGIQ